MQVKPTHVLNAAGLTGRPNVDWCEDHKVYSPCSPNPTFPTVKQRPRLPTCKPSRCRDHPLQIETIRVNVLGALNLADICSQKDIHLTVYATGCIFHYDKDFPQGSGRGFTESDTPNFTGSYYSYTKVKDPPCNPVDPWEKPEAWKRGKPLEAGKGTGWGSNPQEYHSAQGEPSRIESVLLPLTSKYAF